MRMNKTASRLETVSWEESECEFCVVVLLVSQPLSYPLIFRDVEMLPAITHTNCSADHSCLSL